MIQNTLNHIKSAWKQLDILEKTALLMLSLIIFSIPFATSPTPTGPNYTPNRPTSTPTVLGKTQAITSHTQSSLLAQSSPTPTPSPTSSQQQACQTAGGTWREFPNGCADICGAGPICTQAFIDSCDCGLNSCWDGSTCSDTGGTCLPTDLNADGTVNSSDTQRVIDNLFSTTGLARSGDVNGDGITDITDYSLVVADFDQTSTCN